MSQVLPIDVDDAIPPPAPPIGTASDITHEVLGNLSISDGLNVAGMDIGPGKIRTNTPMGLDTMKLNTTGYNNTSVGFRSMRYQVTGDSNSAYGYKALYSNVDGSGNTGIGAKALFTNVSGDRNVAVGESAGVSITGTRNTALGEGSDVSAGINHSTAIGSEASVTTDNTIAIGTIDDVTLVGGTTKQGILNKLQVYGGNSAVHTAGFGFAVKEGANCRQGVATLSGSTVYVSNTSVTENSRIFLTHQTISGTPGVLCVEGKTPGAGFTITSFINGGGSSDNSIVAYLIVEGI